MKNPIEVDARQKLIIDLLRSTKREGIEGLIEYLVSSDFFTAPASTRYHGCYRGGLAQHSYDVWTMLVMYNLKLDLGVTEETIIIAALLHDVCKIGAYLGTVKPYKWNRSQPKGHALLSLIRITKHIKLTELEELMIKYHMGVYGLVEFDAKKGEYPLRGGAMANAWFHHPIVKVMYFCDELVTLLESKYESQ